MANDTVTIGFTLRDAAGQPVLTSDQSLYQTALGQGDNLVFLTSPLTVQAGLIGNPAFTGVQAENYYVSQPAPRLSSRFSGRSWTSSTPGSSA